MAKKLRFASALVAIVGLACVTAAAAQEAGVPPTPQQWVGNMVNMQGGGTTRIVVRADSFSPPEEVQNLAAILKEKGQDAAVSAMFKMPARGWIRIGSSLGYQVPVIRYLPTQTGYRIVVVTDRPIQFFEARRNTRSLDYPVGMVIFDLNRDGTSAGQVLPTIKASFDKEGKVELETFGTKPLRVLTVKEEKVK